MWQLASAIAVSAVLVIWLQPKDARKALVPPVQTGAENATATDNSTATASAEAKAPRKGKGSKGPPYPRLPAEERTSARRWTLQELALHDGESRERPLLLAILGEVYDVGPGERFYGPGEGYHVFAGKDASRAFTTGQFNDGAVPGLKGLLPEQISDVISWRSFYQKSDKYRFVGALSWRAGSIPRLA
ncbi:unnamed protein product [Effrenium voratum]|nr:unnamed protein product [Effrenium voratum]